MKFNNEIIILKFLNEKIIIHISKLIDYNFNDNDIFIFFMITQNIKEFPLNIYWNHISKYNYYINDILKFLI